MGVHVKRYMPIIGLAVVLSGCEDAANAIHKAQETANQVMNSVQDKVNLLGLESLNMEQFGSSAEQANRLFLSVQSALSVDFADPAAVAEVEGHVANAYGCLVQNSSSFVADQLVNKLLLTVSNEDVLGLIERGVESGKAELSGRCIVPLGRTG